MLFSVFISRCFKKMTWVAMLSILIFVTGCNSKEENELHETPVASVAVKELKMRPNIAVMKDLDQVFFSIDLKNGVIFNADSLPKGTPVNKIGLNITFADSPESAEIEMTGGESRTGVIDYKAEPTDSIDFTGRVVLTLKNGDLKKSYLLKVNVHGMDPDSLMWDRMAQTTLPSRMENPREQKTVTTGKNEAVSCIREADGTATISVCMDLFSNSWVKTAVDLPAGADVRSFMIAGTVMYILGGDGMLYSASYPLQARPDWRSTGESWETIIGAYGQTVLGLSTVNGTRCHVRYPGDFRPVKADESFPVSDYSNLAVIISEWSENPTALFAGGRLSDGTVSNAIWGYDGRTWAMLAQSPLVARSGAALLPYYTYRRTSSQWIKTEYPAWLLIGGEDINGECTRDVMISYDNGLNWRRGDEKFVLPLFMTPSKQADPVVAYHSFEANLSDGWALQSSKSIHRLPYETDGTLISWECPYIYLFGGADTTGAFNNTIWRGVLARLIFTPLI